MTTYALQAPAHAGAQITWTVPATGDLATPGVGYALMVVNPTANGSSTVSLPMPASDGVTVGPRVITCPAGTTAPTVIPLPPAVYGTSPVTLTWTGTVANISVALIVIP
jgi:hypothetical protein